MAEGLLPPTKEGIGAMTKLDQLYAEKRKKFDEICALLARELGYGEFATISAEDRKQVELQVEQHVKEMGRDDGIPNSSQHQTHHAPTTSVELASVHMRENPSDEQEIEVGIWAYKRGSRCQRQLASR